MQSLPAETELACHVNRIALSDEEDDDYDDCLYDDEASGQVNRYGSDGEEDEPVIPEQALELLKMEQVIRSGYILKKGEKRRTWKKRWLVLRTTKLAFYKDDKEYKLLRIVDLDQVRSVVHVTSKAKYKYMFAITTPKRTYYLQAPSEQEMKGWTISIEQTKMAAAENHHHEDNDPPMVRRHNHVPPVNIPIKANSQQQQQSTSLAAYSTNQSYPLSPNADMNVMEGFASSDDEDDDDDEYSWTEDMSKALQEESRNRVLMNGYLLKLCRNKSWRKRWFVLRPDTIAYYKDEKEYVPHRIVPLSHIIDSLEIDPVSKNKRHCFKIIILKRSYILCASSEMERISWLEALNHCVRRVKATHGATAIHHHHHHHHPITRGPPPLSTPTEEIQRRDSFDNASNISDMSGSGAIGGAGGALPGRQVGRG